MAEQENEQSRTGGQDEKGADDSTATGGKQTTEREQGEASTDDERTGEGTGAKAGEYS